MRIYLDFEKPLEEIENKIEELRQTKEAGEDVDSELANLELKVSRLRTKIFSELTPWQRCQVARHPDRPYTLDYINRITDEFIELHGDRAFADDPAIVGGLSKINGQSVMIIGHQKGRSLKERIYRNFGQPNPEGYRKALRLIRLAERFSIPIVTLIDTQGAYPGIGAEERGQSEAIASNLMALSGIQVPIVSIVIGEGGSGGALALAVADRIYMLENSIYSVISPEGCAAILWKVTPGSPNTNLSTAAEALKLTSRDLLSFRIIDDIIREPQGGAHMDHNEAARNIKRVILNSIEELRTYSTEELLENRYNKLTSIGEYTEMDDREMA
ncbi:MAG: acetyl-CoA carboxylase carboxyltransferase subunit alpha [Nitrospirae bacterium]|nr:acetyl-CoA carboxylase carboxyltransferase subunit alpha [Nitrospirota bacterium]